MDRDLFEQLKSEPDANNSSLQLNAEYQQREHQRMLRNMKRKPTPAEVEQAKKNFAAINAVNELEKQLEQDSIVAQRAREVAEEIAAALKDVATPDEVAEVCRRVEPLLKRFVTSLSDYQIVEWCRHTLEVIRNEKAARELAGL